MKAPPTPTKTLHVSALVDGAAMRGLIAYAPLLCGLLMIVEGLDTYGIGYVGPMLSGEYGISPKALGVIYSGTVAASLFGAVVLGPLADRVGARMIVVASGFVLAFATLATPFASNPASLFVARFLIGMAFGAALPSAFALCADYAPEALRARLLMIIMSGVGVGVIMAGIASAYIIPGFGWKALLLTYGAFSLLIAIVMLFLLPESLRFAVLRHPEHASTRRLASRILREQGIAPEQVVLVSEERPLSRPILELLRGGRAPLTLILSCAMTGIYSVQFFNSSWLPTLVMETGASVKTSGLVMACAKVGSIAGDIVLGWAMDRKGAWRTLVASFTAAVICVIGLGLFVSTAAAAFGLLIAACFFIDGSFAGVMVVAASSYPFAMRATATGWVTGIARLIGGSAGSLAGGLVVVSRWTTWQTSLLIAVPLAITAMILLVGIALQLPQRAAADKG